jgi:NADH dehydrogenase
MHRVVIVGGGFAGLKAVRRLRRVPVQVTLIDRRNHHLFQPLLYQVATGALSPANIASPLRNILRHQQNVIVLLGEVVDIDAEAHVLRLRDGDQIEYDTLLVAAGSAYNYFGHDEWAHVAPGLKSIEDATLIRRRILNAFEEAEKADDLDKIHHLRNFVVVGGGPTGVELSGAIAELARDTLRHEFRKIHPPDARVFLIEAGDRILSAYPPELSKNAEQSLQQLGVTVRTNTQVVQVDCDAVLLRGESNERLPTHSVFWAAGVTASPLARKLAKATGAAVDRMGRIQVAPDFTVPGHRAIFVVGDMAHYAHQDGKPLPALAPVAMQEAAYVAKVIESRVFNRPPPHQFRYIDRGTMATIGRGHAVADIKGGKFTGTFAWLVWLFVHLMQIVQFQNRLLVFIQWAWHYLTLNRGARLITGQDEPCLPLASESSLATTAQHRPR